MPTQINVNQIAGRSGNNGQLIGINASGQPVFTNTIFANVDATVPLTIAGFSASQSADLFKVYQYGTSNQRLSLTTAGLLTVAAGITITTGDITNTAGNYIFGAASALICANTSDAADTKSVSICGGGSNSSIRGARISLYGNEHASVGALIIEAGNVTGGDVQIQANGATQLSVLKSIGVTASSLLTASVGLTVTNGPTSLTGLSTGSSTALSVIANHASNVVAKFKMAATPSADVINITNSSDTVLTRFDNNGWLGVGVADPLGLIHIAGTANDDTDNAKFDRFNGSPAALIFRTARGANLAAATAIQLNDGIFTLGGRGYGATGFTTGSKVAVLGFAGENWSDTANGTYLTFNTTDNTTTTLDERMRIAHNGYVGIGTTSSTTMLNVTGPGTYDASSGRYSIAGFFTSDAYGIDVGATVNLGGKYDGANYVTYAAIRSGKTNASSGDATGYMALHTFNQAAGYTKEWMRITTLGYVGINEVAPGARLHVNTGGDAIVGQIIRRNSATQSANLLCLQSSTPTILTCFDKDGVPRVTASTGYQYDATPGTLADGSWRTEITSDNYIVERRESSAWVSKLISTSTGNLVLPHATANLIRTNTADGSDASSIEINGGGATGSTRGGYLVVYGNEHASVPAAVRIGYAGTAAAAGTVTFGANNITFALASSTVSGNGISLNASSMTSVIASYSIIGTVNSTSTNITTYYGIDLGAITGARTSSYGLRVGDVSGATNNYSIYSGIAKSKFNGPATFISDGVITADYTAATGTTAAVIADFNLASDNLTAYGFYVYDSTLAAHPPTAIYGFVCKDVSSKALCTGLQIDQLTASDADARVYGAYITGGVALGVAAHTYGVYYSGTSSSGLSNYGVCVGEVYGATNNYPLYVNGARGISYIGTYLQVEKNCVGAGTLAAISANTTTSATTQTIYGIKSQCSWGYATTTAYGVYVSQNRTADVSGSTMYGVYIDAIGHASYTAGYGLYIANMLSPTTAYAIYTNTGKIRFGDDVLMSADTAKVIFGAGADVEMYYDGTDMKIVTDIVAASDFVVDCGTAKTLELAEPVWEDIRIASGMFDLPGAADPAIVAYVPSGAGGTTYLWEFSKNDIISFTVQIPHAYKEASDVKVHIHWTPGPRGNEENGATVGWKISYSWANIDGTFGAMATADLSDACDGTDHKHQMTPDVSISGAGKTISSILLCTLTRTDTGADDTWAGTAAGELPMLIEVDIHFSQDTVGSRTSAAK